MGFWRSCHSDPLLDYIRETYTAVPMKLPDSRIVPMSLLTVLQNRARFLGTMDNLVPESTRSKTLPRAQSAELPDVARSSTSRLGWSLALQVLSPYLTALFSQLPIDLTGSLTGALTRKQTVSLSLARARRSFVSPFGVAATLERAKPRVPSAMDVELGTTDSKPLFLVDSVLTAGELQLGIEGESAVEAAVSIESALAGKLSPEVVIRNESRLTIIGKQRVPFAFTCIRLRADELGAITSVEMDSVLPRAGATGMGGAPLVRRPEIGDHSELFFIDD